MELINSDINIIGGIPDFSLIEVTLSQFAKGNGIVDLKELLVTNNAFDFRTESTRSRFLYAMQRNILVFANDKHKQLIAALFAAPGLESLKQRAVFWQLLAGNDLFRAISKDVYAKVYFSGRITLASSEVYAYLKDLQSSTTRASRPNGRPAIVRLWPSPGELLVFLILHPGIPIRGVVGLHFIQDLFLLGSFGLSSTESGAGSPF